MIYKPKNYRCVSCGREQYTNCNCYGCENKEFVGIENPSVINYEQAWKDLRNKFIDQISFEGNIDNGDLKKVMDEMIIDYRY